MALHDTHPNSRKVHIGSLRVPMREISLSGGEPPLMVYDTSGPESHDVRDGLPQLRKPWILSRANVEVARSARPDDGRGGHVPVSLSRDVLRGTRCVTQLH